MKFQKQVRGHVAGGAARYVDCGGSIVGLNKNIFNYVQSFTNWLKIKSFFFPAEKATNMGQTEVEKMEKIILAM